MNASKENAREALTQVITAKNASLKINERLSSFKFIEEFLLAAERKLPSEKSYEREKQRKRKSAKKIIDKNPKSIPDFNDYQEAE